MNFVSFTSKFSTNSHNKPKELYKHLIRKCRKLPVGPREYYKFMIRQSYKQHVHEHDKERINQIINRAYEDAEWVLKKYLGNKNK